MMIIPFSAAVFGFKMVLQYDTFLTFRNGLSEASRRGVEGPALGSLKLCPASGAKAELRRSYGGAIHEVKKGLPGCLFEVGFRGADFAKC